MNDSTDKTPSRRHAVVWLAVSLAVVTYMQRHGISVALPAIQEDLGLNKAQMGLALSAFLWMYAICEIPGGYAGDRWGSRRVLAIIVGAWSLCLAATGWVWNFWSLVAARGCFGTFQAGCFPNIARMFADWLPAGDRVRAQGIMWLSARWGGALAPLIVVVFLEYLNWRIAFAVFGLLGFVWVAFFWWWFREPTAADGAATPEEVDALPAQGDTEPHHAKIPWRLFLRSRTVWLLCGQYMCLNFGWQFFVTWLPTYLMEDRGLSLRYAALLAALPLFLGGLGSWWCGSVSSWLDRVTGSVKITRRLLAGTGFTVAAICFAIFGHIPSPIWAMCALGVASFANDLVMPTSWATCMDVGGRYCGTLSGGMNMMGGIVGTASPAVIGWIVYQSDEYWILTFYLSAAIYLLGAVFWLFLDPVSKIEEE